MISGKTMGCCKVRRILQYLVPNKFLSPQKRAHHVLLLFFPVRDEREWLSDFPLIYQDKLEEQGVQDVIHVKKIKFEPYGDLVDQACSKFNETLIINENPHSQIEIYK